MKKIDALRICIDDNDATFMFDKRYTQQVLGSLIAAAGNDDDLRDIVLTSASVLIARDRDARSQYDIFKGVVEEMMKNNKKLKS